MLLSSSKNLTTSEISLADPISFKGCLFFALSNLVSELRNFSDMGVSKIDGAIVFTLIFGANSAANALVSPSIAPFEDDTEL